MGYFAWKVKLSYEMARMLPPSDPVYKEYISFKERFGEDGSVMTIGIEDDSMFTLSHFTAWYDLGNEIRKIEGVEEVASSARIINISKDTVAGKFVISPVVSRRPESQAEVDSLKQVITSLPFYNKLLFNLETNVWLMGVTLDKKKLDDKSRVNLVNKVQDLAGEFSTKMNVKFHLSGLPYIRTVTTQKVKNELNLFILLSIGVSILILMLFFRSLKVILSSLIIVIISVIWTLGTISLFGFKITILTGVIPSLIIIIAIENCIYILNKYHWEYKSHGNKVKALSRVVQRIGFASLVTNTATALGFAAFILIPNAMLREFGIITSLNILLEYLLTIVLLPVILSYLNPPSAKHTEHLENRSINRIIEKIIFVITHKRRIIYLLTIVLLGFTFWGISFMRVSGKVVDDLRKDDPVYVDLKFFEKHFGGVMPFEISLNTGSKNGVMKISSIKKIEKIQETIGSYAEFSKPLSLAEMVKFAKQSFYNGDTTKYSIPNNYEKNFILSYLPTDKNSKKGILRPFIDSTGQYTRISFQMKDVGTYEMKHLLDSIRPQIDSLFKDSKTKATITGNSIVYTKGTEFLIRHLIVSVCIAIAFISLLMVVLFSSVKMILVTMLPNIIPLLITAGIMGFTNIPIKPSTIIIFSIALGISVDNAIQYLSRYRHELKVLEGNISKSVIGALHEAGFSMIYTSIVLVLGFSVFIISEFGGTQALGILISATLFIAMFFNMIVLPSLLMSLDKRVTTKAFEESTIELFDEQDTDENEENNHNTDKPQSNIP